MKYDVENSENITEHYSENDPMNYDYNYDYNYDMKIEEAEENHTCNVCNKSFDNVEGLRKHTVKVHETKNFNINVEDNSCNICNEKFENTKSLKRHMVKHNGSIYNCNICNKKFKYELRLKTHIEVEHEGVKKNQCKQCPENFVFS